MEVASIIAELAADRSFSDSAMYRVLYFSPVGGTRSREFFSGIKTAFGSHSEFKLIVYDESDTSDFGEVDVSHEKGHKWPLAKKYLRPEAIDRFDYIAIWDDDIEAGSFEIQRFCELMEHNRLVMAQPSIRSPYWISHPIVCQQPQPVGRFTNFVEIMVPVFSREGWRMMYPYLTDENTSGWGYDYLPIEPRGVIDCMYVVHTRPVQSDTPQAHAQLRAFHGRHGLHQYETQNLGSLEEPVGKTGAS